MMVLCQWYGMLTMLSMMLAVVETHTCFEVIIDGVSCLNVVSKKCHEEIDDFRPSPSTHINL